LTVFLTACGGYQVALSPEETPTDAPISTINDVFSPCAYPDADRAPAFEYMESAAGWQQLMDVSDADEDQTSPSMVPSRIGVLGEDGIEYIDITGHSSFWPGVNWVLANGGSAWAAIADPAVYEIQNLVLYVVAVMKDGRTFFPGECQALALYSPLESRFGEDVDSVVRAMPGSSPDELSTLLGEASTDTTASTDIVVLNPETASATLLDSLQFSLVDATISTPLGDLVICSKSSAGWNDCFPADGRAADIGYVVDAYLGDDGVLEFWLMNGDADLAHPLGLLGSIVGSDSAGRSQDIALLVAIDTAGIQPGEPVMSGRVTLLESIPIEKIDDRVEHWEALEESGMLELVSPGDE
jgi:hypothetical protein